MQYAEQAGAVVLSPHLDDAVLSAWSAIRTPNASAVVICAAVPPSGTQAADDRVYGVEDSSELVVMRLKEDAEAMAIAECPAQYLDFLDGAYRDTELPPAELCDAIEQAVPVAGVLCAPAGIGRHADHVAVREAALTVARAGGVPVRLYADIPYAVRMGWPGWVSGAPARPHLILEETWRNDLDATGASFAWNDLSPCVHRLDPTEIARKLRAVEAYRTQYEALNAGPLDRMRNPEVIGFELHWELRT